MSDHNLQAGLETAIASGKAFPVADSGMSGTSIPAEAIRQVILGWSEGQAFAGKLWLRGMRIDGDLDLEAFEVKMRLIFERCEIPGNVNLQQATVSDVTFFRSQVGGAIQANQLRARSTLRLVSSSVSKGLSLVDAKIEGQLVLNGTVLGTAQDAHTPALAASGIQVNSGIVCTDGFKAHGEVTLAGAAIGGYLDLTGAVLNGGAGPDGVVTALRADGVDIAGAFACAHPFQAVGVLRLPGARIGGSMLMVGAKITGQLDEDREVTALNADGLEIAGNFICRHMQAEGVIRLPAARVRNQISMDRARVKGAILLLSAEIGREFGLSGAQLDGDGGPALIADRMHVGQGLFLDEGFSSVGEVSLVDAKIDSTLGFGSATLKSQRGPNPEVYVLNARGVEVTGDIECSANFSATGGVRFENARVDGKMSFMDASFRNDREGGVALSLRYATAREIALGLSRINGVLDMGQATVDSIYDAENGRFIGEHPEDLRLDGLTYRSFREPLDAKQRLSWLAPSQGARYYPAVYVELANAFRRIGHGADARKVLIAGERRAQRELRRSNPRRLLNNFLWLTVGYGYRNWLAFVWLLGLILGGTIVFTISGESHFDSLHVNGPPFEPGLMAIDATVPVLDIAQGNVWAATGGMAWVSVFLSISGYALATAVIAAAAGILNREQR